MVSTWDSLLTSLELTIAKNSLGPALPQEVKKITKVEVIVDKSGLYGFQISRDARLKMVAQTRSEVN